MEKNKANVIKCLHLGNPGEGCVGILCTVLAAFLLSLKLYLDKM